MKNKNELKKKPNRQRSKLRAWMFNSSNCREKKKTLFFFSNCDDMFRKWVCLPYSSVCVYVCVELQTNFSAGDLMSVSNKLFIVLVFNFFYLNCASASFFSLLSFFRSDRVRFVAWFCFSLNSLVVISFMSLYVLFSFNCLRNH